MCNCTTSIQTGGFQIYPSMTLWIVDDIVRVRISWGAPRNHVWDRLVGEWMLARPPEEIDLGGV